MSHTKAKMILITGLPSTGKTHLAKIVSTSFSLPLFSKDEIKETLFNHLGYSDRMWSKKLGVASFGLLYKLIETQLKSNQSLIAETYFKSELASPILSRLQTKYRCSILQIKCFAHSATLIKRFTKRAQSKERHPGHKDSENLLEWKNHIKHTNCTFLDLDCQRIEFDTNTFESINYQKLKMDIKSFLNEKNNSG